MGRIKVLAVVFGIMGVSSSAKAVYIYKFTMDGSQEVQPVVTSATGECTVTLDESSNTVSVACTYTGLSSNASNAHIHSGAVGVIGPPIVALAFTAAPSGTATVTDAAISPADTAAMIAGNTYVNIHSQNHSGGEIRGQITGQVPAVSTWGLLATALLVVTAGTIVMRRRSSRLSTVVAR